MRRRNKRPPAAAMMNRKPLLFSAGRASKYVAALFGALVLGGCAMQCNGNYIRVCLPGFSLPSLPGSSEDSPADKTWNQLQAGDPATVVRCFLSLSPYAGGMGERRCTWPSGIDAKKMMVVRLRSADQIISWWADKPSPAQLSVLLEAYRVKGESYLNVDLHSFDPWADPQRNQIKGYVPADPARAEALLREAAKLAVDPNLGAGLIATDYYPDASDEGELAWMRGGRKRLYEYGMRAIQGDLMILRYRQDSGHPPTPESFQCQAVAAWPPASISIPLWVVKKSDAQSGGDKQLELANDRRRMLQGACSDAYQSLFGKGLTASQVSAMPIVPGIYQPVSEN